MGVSVVTVYKMAEPVAQQMRNCVCKTQTATTGTRPPLVASQYTLKTSKICTAGSWIIDRFKVYLSEAAFTANR